MLILLSGGTGTPKLIQGFMELLPHEDISVIVNTAEDHWLPHGYFSPDIDTVVYTLAGLINDDAWHGIKDDTFYTHEKLRELGSSEYLKIGDRDRALHIWKGEELKKGLSFSEITDMHCEKFGVKASVIPMSNDPVETVIDCREGEMDLHRFWVKNRGSPEVENVRFTGIESAHACREAVKAIEKADKVIIGPSNPVTSILPIVSLSEISNTLNKNRDKVIGVSPFVGGGAISGPAEKLMNACVIEPSVRGLVEFYKDMVSKMIVDNVEETPDIIEGVEILKTNIIMDDLVKKKSLADYILKLSI